MRYVKDRRWRLARGEKRFIIYEDCWVAEATDGHGGYDIVLHGKRVGSRNTADLAENHLRKMLKAERIEKRVG
jgi:hypothetical protein